MVTITRSARTLCFHFPSTSCVNARSITIRIFYGYLFMKLDNVLMERAYMRQWDFFLPMYIFLFDYSNTSHVLGLQTKMGYEFRQNVQSENWKQIAQYLLFWRRNIPSFLFYLITSLDDCATKIIICFAIKNELFDFSTSSRIHARLEAQTSERCLRTL